MDESPRRERLTFVKFSSGAIDGHRPSKVSGCRATDSVSSPRELSMGESPGRERLKFEKFSPGAADGHISDSQAKYSVSHRR